MKMSEFPEIEKCLHEFLKKYTNTNVPVNDTLLKQKAHQFAKMLVLGDKFKASNG